MAEVAVKVETVAQVVGYSIELTVEEAKFLHMVMGARPAGEALSGAIYEALQAADVDS